MWGGRVSCLYIQKIIPPQMYVHTPTNQPKIPTQQTPTTDNFSAQDYHHRGSGSGGRTSTVGGAGGGGGGRYSDRPGAGSPNGNGAYDDYRAGRRGYNDGTVSPEEKEDHHRGGGVGGGRGRGGGGSEDSLGGSGGGRRKMEIRMKGTGAVRFIDVWC